MTGRPSPFPVAAYGVYTAAGTLVLPSIRRTESAAIAEFLGATDYAQAWKPYTDAGFTCAPVSIMPVVTETSDVFVLAPKVGEGEIAKPEAVIDREFFTTIPEAQEHICIHADKGNPASQWDLFRAKLVMTGERV